MNKIFLEFENENTQRTYPFASGCHPVDTDGNPIGAGLLIDAALYPLNPKGSLYLSGISASGEVLISDSSGVIMSAKHEQGSDTLEFFEVTGLGRHTGTLLGSSSEAIDILVSGNKERTFRRQATEFAASCVFPIENDGILSLNIGETGLVDGLVEFKNSDTDEIRVSTNETGTELRFDALPRPTVDIPESIQHIYCIVDGRTPFRIVKIPSGMDGIPGNTVAVYLDNLDRQAVCNNAHRENALVMTDTCDCSSSPEDPDPVDIPEVYQEEVVDIPNGADSAFHLAVPNFTGYDNPLSLTLSDGISLPKTEIEVTTDPTGRKSGGDSLLEDTTSKGSVLQVPGLAPL